MGIEIRASNRHRIGCAQRRNARLREPRGAFMRSSCGLAALRPSCDLCAILRRRSRPP
ncbi:hypothetical protein C7S16_6837 [Burkholderia thailandensis]|uniref:Uncharacterized protein n=1 Tax=Burkholderia thailandensis TaxID=57975 RepID=A0AAW9CQA5_BURTH|nr:hypothetical protein [Burkholderia thailandensis]